MMKRIAILIALICALIISASPAFAKSPDIVRIAENIDIPSGMVVNDVVAIGGDVTVYGKVESNIVAVGGRVSLKRASCVVGEIVIVGGSLLRENGSVTSGRLTQINMPYFIPSLSSFLKGGWIAVWATISVLVLLGFLGLAILLVALIPENMGTAVNAMEKSFARMLLWGLVWMILVVPIAVILAISVIGIILIPLEILLVGLALIIGYIAGAIYIGKSILRAFKTVSPPFVDAVLGILILFLIGFVPVAGHVVKALFLLAGFGAVVASRFGTVK
jgi:hypothetical protein